MKKFISILSLCLVAAMLIPMLVSCDAKDKFVGTWEELDDDGTVTGTTMTLANDGTGSISSDGMSGSISWSVEKDKLFLTVSICGMSETSELTYKFSGKTMILTDTDGETTTYRKVSK